MDMNKFSPQQMGDWVTAIIKKEIEKEYNEILEEELPWFLEGIKEKMQGKSLKLLSRIAIMIKERMDVRWSDLIVKIPFSGF